MYTFPIGYQMNLYGNCDAQAGSCSPTDFSVFIYSCCLARTLPPIASLIKEKVSAKVPHAYGECRDFFFMFKLFTFFQGSTLLMTAPAMSYARYFPANEGIPSRCNLLTLWKLLSRNSWHTSCFVIMQEPIRASMRLAYCDWFSM